MLGTCQPHIRELQLRPLRRASQLIARYSYAVYLSHLICIWASFEYLHHWPPPLRWVVFVASASALPVALYHGLEQPMILLGGRLAAKLSRAPVLSR